MEIRIVDIIKDLCRKYDTSIPKIEKEIGLSNGSIYNWNKSYPSFDKVIKVADYFNVSLDVLAGKKSITDKGVVSESNNVQKEEPISFMAARKSEGVLTDDETILLKKLAQLLISDKIDEIKDK